MKKKNIYKHQYVVKPKGFSLIEFMVASILSIIVLIAVGSGYFAARKVNDVAVARLNAQQDIRNLSNMVVYDARMAGDFVCFNLSNVDTNNGISIDHDHQDVNNIRRLDRFAFSQTVNLSEGVKSISQDDFSKATGGVAGFTAQSTALVFQYGEGAPVVSAAGARNVTIKDDATTVAFDKNAPVAVSTCNTMGIYSGNSAKSNDNNIVTVNADLNSTMTSASALPELSLARYIVNIYVVGTYNNQQGLYRIRLGVDNNWETPQLLLPNINNMNILYGYVNGCPTIDPDAASNADESFQFTNTPQPSNLARPLATVRLILNSNTLEAEGQLMAGAASRESAGDVYVYNIDANIRGGNKCANR